MTKEELQERIDRNNTSPENMRRIAESYLKGDVVRDLVAAEAWLMKVIEQEDMEESPLAMALLIKEVMGREQVMTEQEYLEIKKDIETAEGLEKERLENLLEIAKM